MNAGCQAAWGWWDSCVSGAPLAGAVARVGRHEVVCPVGSSSLGNARVELLGPFPGSTGIPLSPRNGVPYELRLLLVGPLLAGGIGRSEGGGVTAGVRCWFCCSLLLAFSPRSRWYGTAGACPPFP